MTSHRGRGPPGVEASIPILASVQIPSGLRDVKKSQRFSRSRAWHAKTPEEPRGSPGVHRSGASPWAGGGLPRPKPQARS